MKFVFDSLAKITTIRGGREGATTLTILNLDYLQVLRTPVHYIDVQQFDGQNKNMHQIGKHLKPEPVLSPMYFNLQK